MSRQMLMLILFGAKVALDIAVLIALILDRHERGRGDR